jgi:hypothetical protein
VGEIIRTGSRSDRVRWFNKKQRALVDDERRRFAKLNNYLALISHKLRDDLTAQIRADNSGWQEVVQIPEEVPDRIAVPK